MINRWESMIGNQSKNRYQSMMITHNHMTSKRKTGNATLVVKCVVKGYHAHKFNVEVGEKKVIQMHSKWLMDMAN